ncbi:uncharacterized protein METZ01_LOCUS110814, partial [marine metagenome]
MKFHPPQFQRHYLVSRYDLVIDQ